MDREEGQHEQGAMDQVGPRRNVLEIGPRAHQIDPAHSPQLVGAHPHGCYQEQEGQPLKVRPAQPGPDQCKGQSQQEQVVVPADGASKSIVTIVKE